MWTSRILLSRPRILISCACTVIAMCCCIYVRILFVTGVDTCEIMQKLSSQNDSEYQPNVGDVDASNLNAYDQMDPTLVAYVGRHYITKPSTLPYAFAPRKPTGIIEALWPILKNITGESETVFFVEAGVYDGIGGSNTLFLERSHGWSGLIIECHPELVPLVRQKHRKSYISDACLSISSHPELTELTAVKEYPGSSSLGTGDNVFPGDAKTFKTFTVQSIPLYTLLASINVTVVDFISLDVQSIEYDVLKHFPFDLILIKAWVIEVALFSPEVKANITNLMEKNGYCGPTLVTEYDHFYLHKSVESTNLRCIKYGIR